MKDDHREKAAMALARFRKEVREAGFSEDELATSSATSRPWSRR